MEWPGPVAAEAKVTQSEGGTSWAVKELLESDSPPPIIVITASDADSEAVAEFLAFMADLSGRAAAHIPRASAAPPPSAVPALAEILPKEPPW